MPATDQTQPFPLLRLPKELRLIVYEHPPLSTSTTAYSRNGTLLILSATRFPTTILRASKLVFAEALPMFERLETPSLIYFVGYRAWAPLSVQDFTHSQL
ncbi:hypothetical protein E8E11_009087 [Didymella keratinophila]|nr:hypothetical protein E8E11_009087 [Didymella keratinophila]